MTTGSEQWHQQVFDDFIRHLNIEGGCRGCHKPFQQQEAGPAWSRRIVLGMKTYHGPNGEREHYHASCAPKDHPWPDRLPGLGDDSWPAQRGE